MRGKCCWCKHQCIRHTPHLPPRLPGDQRSFQNGVRGRMKRALVSGLGLLLADEVSVAKGSKMAVIAPNMTLMVTLTGW